MTPGEMSAVLQVFPSTLIHFHPVCLHFIHVPGNEYFRSSKQASKTSELGTEGLLLFGNSFCIRFGIIPAASREDDKQTCTVVALLVLSQPLCFSPRNCFQRTLAWKAMCHSQLLASSAGY